MALAEEKGIPAPRTVVVRERADPGSVCPRWSRPASRVWNCARHPLRATPAELDAACHAVGQTSPFPMIQEYIPGEGRGIFVLMNRGRLRAVFGHRRLREKRPSGGVSVLSESAAVDPKLLEDAERVLEALKWHGVAMVEFKRDARDGVSKLFEINGRFWGSLQLAVDAGVDFPTLLYRLAVEGDEEPVLTYDVGLQLRWWLRDLDWLVLRLREKNDMAKRRRAIAEFLRSAGRTTRAEVLRRDDPAPAGLELAQCIRAALGGVLGKLAR